MTSQRLIITAYLVSGIKKIIDKRHYWFIKLYWHSVAHLAEITYNICISAICPTLGVGLLVSEYIETNSDICGCQKKIRMVIMTFLIN